LERSEQLQISLKVGKKVVLIVLTGAGMGLLLGQPKQYLRLN